MVQDTNNIIRANENNEYTEEGWWGEDMQWNLWNSRAAQINSICSFSLPNTQNHKSVASRPAVQRQSHNLNTAEDTVLGCSRVLPPGNQLPSSHMLGCNTRIHLLGCRVAWLARNCWSGTVWKLCSSSLLTLLLVSLKKTSGFACLDFSTRRICHNVSGIRFSKMMLISGSCSIYLCCKVYLFMYKI